jgi:hypothetical protein
MRQEMIVAMQYKDVFPDRYIEIAKKYTADDWVECGKAILAKMKEEKVTLYQLLELVQMARRL